MMHAVSTIFETCNKSLIKQTNKLKGNPKFQDVLYLQNLVGWLGSPGPDQDQEIEARQSKTTNNSQGNSSELDKPGS